MTHITIRMAMEEDASSIVDIMETVAKNLEDPEIYVTDDEAFIRRHIKDQGFTELAECDGGAVGFLIVHIPGDGPENLGRDAGLPDRELPFTAHMESAAVLPAYRGHGIQRMLMMEAEKELRRRGFHYAVGTVSPKNPYSMENCLKLGYLTAAVRNKYGSLLRNIVVKRL